MKPILFVCSLLLLIACQSIDEPLKQDYFNPVLTSIDILTPSEGDTVKLDPDDFLRIEGISSGLSSTNFDLDIYILVFPVIPFGGGWFVQETPGQINADGSWFAQAHFGGNGGFIANPGDVYNIAGVVTCKADSLKSIIQHDPPRIESFNELPLHQVSGFVKTLLIEK